jgi:putative transposase
MDSTENEQLVTMAFQMALARRHPQTGLMHHSDWGSEYTSRGYQALLAELGIVVSMSRTANCHDNAAMESFFDTLKSECVDRAHFPNQAQARSAIFEYLECWYNPVRLYSTLEYVSPLVYEQAFAQSVR